MTDSFAPLLRTDADVTEMWRRLMTPLGVAEPTLWLVLVGPDDVPLPVVHEFAEAPEQPTAEDVEAFAHFLAGLLEHFEPGLRAAVLASRPGGGGLRPSDRQWAADLYAAARRHGVPLELPHVSTDDALLPVPLDELGVGALDGPPRPAA